MLTWLAYAGSTILGAILYGLGYELTKATIESIRQRKNSGGRDKIDLSGTWYAVWQTTVEGKENINSELLDIAHKRGKLTIENKEKSPENKLGGYLWRAQCGIYDNAHIIGCYVSRERNVVSKGSLYFSLNRSGNFMLGKWVGCNYDYELTWGNGVIAKDKQVAIAKMRELLNTERGVRTSVAVARPMIPVQHTTPPNLPQSPQLQLPSTRNPKQMEKGK